MGNALKLGGGGGDREHTQIQKLEPKESNNNRTAIDSDVFYIQ